MDSVILRTPSVGGIIKKLMALHPELTAPQMIDLIRQSIRSQAQSGVAGEFAQAEVVDEAKVLRLARELSVAGRNGLG